MGARAQGVTMMCVLLSGLFELSLSALIAYFVGKTEPKILRLVDSNGSSRCQALSLSALIAYFVGKTEPKILRLVDSNGSSGNTNVHAFSQVSKV